MAVQSFIGQSLTWDRLLGDLRMNRVPHALMLCGAEGSGKLAIAVAFAQDQHVVFEDYSDFMSEEDYRKLNEDLAQIKENYDIDIYTDSEQESKQFNNQSGVKVWIIKD